MRRFDATPRRATPKGHKPSSTAQQHIKSRIPKNDSLLRSWRTIAEYLCGAEVPDGDWIERRSPGSAGMPPARRRRSRGRERVTQRRYAVCSVRVPGRGPSSDRAGEHESGFVVDSDGRTRFYRLVAVHDAPAVGEVAAPHVDPLRGAVIGVKAHADARHRAPC